MLTRKFVGPVVIACGLAFAGQAGAEAIIGAEGATINSGGPGFGSINNTFNQNGLLTGYVSGVTDFDAYIAGNPLHSLVFVGNEWFNNGSGLSTASVTYDLGVLKSINALAYWNEDGAGVGSLALFTSIDGVNFSALAAGLLPTDHPINTNYGADVFSFGSVSAQYMRIDMSGCPQVNDGFNGCGVGEVAFREAAVPEPGMLGLLGLGLAGIAFQRRRRR